ncbi:MAG TPA: cytochrome b N-terminal domain-containing protein [Pyrinomonadaceae bacterium]|nr:cytochrome b N-terminal domain-containing protein [Pyrinomonadaceae bacterium]
MTTLGETFAAVLDEPSGELHSWARTTAGVVALLLFLQFMTGVLLAFYYVPSTEAAHATVSLVEKVLPAGSWLRALHLYASQLLPLVLLLHLAQGFLRGAHRRRPVGWVASVLLLALVMANGATGYSLPWDARAFYSTRVAEGIAVGLPGVGAEARAWLAGGDTLSTLTLSRFYALHVLVVPALILLAVVARLFVFRDSGAAARDEVSPADGAGNKRRDGAAGGGGGARGAVGGGGGRRREWARAQSVRVAIVCGLVFAGLALYSARHPAPLAPSPDEAPAGYLPRPGAQFLWLFQLLKYFPSAGASLVALLLPALLLGALALLPFLPARPGTRRPAHRAGTALFALIFLLVGGLSALAVREDWRDPRVREQLARQAAAEAEFRRAPFVPKRFGAADPAAVDRASSASTAEPPAAYAQHCARCHGARGEGKSINPPLKGVSLLPRRTVEDLVRIMEDPAAYNLNKRMPSFAGKMTDEEKLVVAEWLTTLR